MGGKLHIIGDVHGMLEPLRALVEKLQLQSEDTLAFVGDLIDKGPDSVGVLHYVETLRRAAGFEVVIVEGNHEDRMRRYLRNLKLRPDVASEQAARSPELDRLHTQLEAKRLPFPDWTVPFFRCPDFDVLVVHGGIPGTMRSFPASVADARALKGRDAKRFEKIFRTRFVHAETGEFLLLGAQRTVDPFWAETYDGRFGHVVFGHQPFFDGPAEFSIATGIDTGAVHGGALTALVLAPGKPRAFVSVPTECHAPYVLDPVPQPF